MTPSIAETVSESAGFTTTEDTEYTEGKTGSEPLGRLIQERAFARTGAEGSANAYSATVELQNGKWTDTKTNRLGYHDEKTGSRII